MYSILQTTTMDPQSNGLQSASSGCHHAPWKQQSGLVSHFDPFQLHPSVHERSISRSTLIDGGGFGYYDSNMNNFGSDFGVNTHFVSDENNTGSSQDVQVIYTYQFYDCCTT